MQESIIELEISKKTDFYFNTQVELLNVKGYQNPHVKLLSLIQNFWINQWKFGKLQLGTRKLQPFWNLTNAREQQSLIIMEVMDNSLFI